MKRRFVIGMLLVSMLGLLSGRVFAAVKIIATVGDIPITTAEVQRQINTVMPFKVSFHGKMSKEKLATIRAEAVEALIERAYKIAYARDNDISVPDSLVNAAFAKVKSRFKTAAAFNTAVSGETAAGLRASIYRQLLARKAEVVAVEDKIKVTDADIQKYYNENQQTFFMPTQFRASHILIKVDPASNPEERAVLKAKAAALLKRAKSGEDFYNLAYYNSEDRTRYVGGDLGLFHAGQTAKPFEDALKRLQVGGISGLVQTRWGYHIIKLTEKKDPHQLPFAEVRTKIRTQLEKTQRDRFYRQWIDGLKAKYQVEMHGD
ncbi:MAG: hypothetical protein GXP51_10050 [Deltaproteobacteria bacterium]|nr:hypothetical protein [Deltaproteobacteria bacterium]